MDLGVLNSGSSNRDIIVEFDDGVLTLNRQYVTSRSDYFKAMLGGNFIESRQSQIKINGVTTGTMKLILDVANNRCSTISWPAVLDVLSAARMMLFKDVYDFCIDLINQLYLNIDHCLPLISFADKYDLPIIKCSSKYIALLNFDILRTRVADLQLEFIELQNYLGSIYLQTKSEYAVFGMALEWWIRWKCDFDTSKITVKDLVKLLACININMLTNDEVMAICNLEFVACHADLVEFLNTKESLVPEYSSLCQPKLRRSGEPCLISVTCGFRKSFSGDPENAPKHEPVKDCIQIFCFTFEGQKLVQTLNLLDNYDNLEGYTLTTWRNYLYLFGGEYQLGTGIWNTSIWKVDLLNPLGLWEKIDASSFKRRHFKTCTCGDLLFIIGGTGQFRVICEELIYYNFKTSVWSNKIPFPQQSNRQLLWCNVDDSIISIDSVENKVFVLDLDMHLWRNISISTPCTLPPYSSCGYLFYYDSHVYLIVSGEIFRYLWQDETLIPVDCDLKINPDIFEEDWDATVYHTGADNRLVFAQLKHLDDRSEKLYWEILDINTNIRNADVFEVRKSTKCFLLKIFHPNCITNDRVNISR